MRHFRGSRGGRRRSIVPRGSTRSVKYIVNIAAASEPAGTNAHTIINTADNVTLGQVSTTDVGVPVGSRVTKIEIFMPKVNLGAATANFITWTLQRTNTGQSIVSPITSGGNPLRKNIMLTGMIGLGAGQNNSLHVSYKVPFKFQRCADGDVWSIVNDNGLVVSAQYQFIYKLWQ